MVPLNYKLQNAQRVEIMSIKQGGPSRDWLNPELGYVASHRARTKVRQWFKAQQVEETIAAYAGPREFFVNRVAEGVATLVVDAFQAIEVDHHQHHTVHFLVAALGGHRGAEHGRRAGHR